MRAALATMAAAVLLAGCGSSDEQSPADKQAAKKAEKQGDAKAVNKNTRAYLDTIGRCQAAVAIVRKAIKNREADIALADNTTQARDICEEARTQLVMLDTDHFYNEGVDGFGAVDRYKSGLNAVLAYINNPRPSKVIEARDKLAEGDVGATDARGGINKRRKVYGLKAYKP